MGAPICAIWDARVSPKPARGRSLAPGAAWFTRAALSIRERPDLPSRRQLTGAPPSIHWKTGTSFGHRDAWAAGSGPTFTAAVWIGNVDATPSRHLVGGEVAAPLLFDVLEGLEPRGRAALAKVPPPDVAFVEVCALSGRAPTAACPRRLEAPALRSAVPTEPCPYHRAVAVDLATGKALAPGCRDGRRWEVRTFSRPGSAPALYTVRTLPRPRAGRRVGRDPPCHDPAASASKRGAQPPPRR